MKIAIIGAGAAGLCAGKHCVEQKLSFEIFEQTGKVGGTWNYTTRVGVDENGVPVHSSMYKGLKANLPKELMSYEDFPYPRRKESYLEQEDVLEYINNYARRFEIIAYVTFYTRVVQVEPRDGSWFVEVEDVISKRRRSEIFKAVVVCNGHYEKTFVPEIPGVDTFRGRIQHSHDYRVPEPFQNRRVLLLGAGPSGCDISEKIGETASKVYISGQPKSPQRIPQHIEQRPLVQRFDQNLVIFEDGTSEEVDDVVFCTGYQYSFPFLSEKCGVKIDNNYVHPLYKQVICIENPTLGFIGLPFSVCPFPLFDIQVRFFLSTLTHHFKLPSREDMMMDLGRDNARRSTAPTRKYHFLGEYQGDYFDDLANTARIKKIPSVVHYLFLRVGRDRNLNDCFRIIDDEKWEQVA